MATPIQKTILGPIGSFISSRAILAPLLGIFLNPRGLGYSPAQALLLCFSALLTHAFGDLLIDSYIKLLNHLIKSNLPTYTHQRDSPGPR